MSFQGIAVVILFLAALWYVARIIYKSVFKKDGACGGSCKCGIDFSSLPETKK